MKRPVVRVTVQNERGDVLHSETKAALNSGIRASEDAVRAIARTERTSYEGGKPSRVGDVYTRRWTSRQGHVVVATIEKESDINAMGESMTARETLATAKTKLEPHGYMIKKTDYDDYRVYPKGSKDPELGYFTDDLDDAVATGIAMAQKRAPMVRSSRRDQQHLPGIEPGVGPVEIVIPTMGWEQIDGDTDPSAHGGTIATGDGRALEMIKIQPVREYVGDDEAKDVGFPFWTKEAYFDLDDLNPNKKDVKSALDSIGMDENTFADLSPEQRALTIASALFDHGRGEEGPSGWSTDINIPERVKWSGGKVAGPEYLADEDDEFRREILLGDLDVDYESYGPDEDEPTNGLKVSTRGHTVEITEWTDIEAANGEEQPEGEEVVKRSAEVELDELFDPKGQHRGSYSGDDRGVSLVELAGMDAADREKAIVGAAIAYIGYYSGNEEFVDAIGD